VSGILLRSFESNKSGDGKLLSLVIVTKSGMSATCRGNNRPASSMSRMLSAQISYRLSSGITAAPYLFQHLITAKHQSNCNSGKYDLCWRAQGSEVLTSAKS
jgi:hypothetical protein